jgi:hypothetical protein
MEIPACAFTVRVIPFYLYPFWGSDTRAAVLVPPHAGRVLHLSRSPR